MRWILILVVFCVSLMVGSMSGAQVRTVSSEQSDENGKRAQRGPDTSDPGGDGRRTGTDAGNVHIVYALDTSGSMRDKIVKSKLALRKALGQLRQADTFNIITFTSTTLAFRKELVPATPMNVSKGLAFVDAIRVGSGMNISAALELALGMTDTTRIYLMAASGPDSGITDADELLRYIREKNTRQVKIMSLALGLGENFTGLKLLKRIADDNSGSYNYINLSKVDNSPANPPAKLVKKRAPGSRSRGGH